MSRSCDVLATGAVELYYYDELDARERAQIQAHLTRCRECASALEELEIIRRALASRPSVSAPPLGDWSGFMRRLDSAIGAPAAAVKVVRFTPRRYAGLLATAALLAMTTIGVYFAARTRTAETTQPVGLRQAQADPEQGRGVALVEQPSAGAEQQPQPVPVATAGLRKAGEDHFERSKLVVLGLAAKETSGRSVDDWTYERELASALLNDTRIYRMAAEDRGLKSLAGVMRDLEIVLLETSMAQASDTGALGHIQRLIRRRGLIQKMDTVVGM
jgi:hypothetical protein